jgi:hypothetical protein
MSEPIIIPKILESKSKQIKAFPQHTNRASSIGHPCIRLLVLKRRHWEDIPMIDVGLKLRFELGDIFEKKVLRDLEESGFDIFQMQQPFYDKETNISGHIDTLSSPLVFPRINSIDDMLNSKYPYMQAYPYQNETYMMLGGYDRSPFIFIDKSSGSYKEIWQEANKERQEEIKEKARIIDEHLKNDTTPDCIQYDENICGRCDLRHICMPVRKADSVIIEAETDLIEALKRRQELIDNSKEYARLDKYVKAKLKGKSGIVDDFYIESKEISRKGYTVKDTSVYTTKITLI